VENCSFELRGGNGALLKTDLEHLFGILNVKMLIIFLGLISGAVLIQPNQIHSQTGPDGTDDAVVQTKIEAESFDVWRGV
jgi:hypothetical protein